MENLFHGKVAIITGGASGIGQAAAVLYAGYGARIVVADLNEKGCNETIELVHKAGGEGIFIKTNVSKASEVEAMVKKTIQQYGRLDIAFNNAGIGGESSAIADMTVEGWLKVIDVNLNSVFYCMKYEIPEMLKQNGGAIVNMSSILGQVAFPSSAAYVAAKHGVVGLSQNAAVEYAKKGIRVNAVGPAFIDTPLLGFMDANTKAAITALHPIGRLGEASEVAELVVWLSSRKASFVTGSYYAIDGGYLAV